jgi:hypothetical protein
LNASEQAEAGHSVGSPSAQLSVVNSIDIRFCAPRSFTLLLAGLHEGALHLDARNFATIYENVALSTARVVRRHLRCPPGALDFGAAPFKVDAFSALGDADAGVHHHVQIQPLETGRGQRIGKEVELDKLRATLVRSVWGGYLRELRQATSERGVVWGRPLPGAPYEIVDPPLAEYVNDCAAATACGCPRYGDEVIVLPDVDTLDREAQEQGAVLLDAARSGTSYWTPPQAD